MPLTATEPAHLQGSLLISSILPRYAARLSSDRAIASTSITLPMQFRKAKTFCSVCLSGGFLLMI
jgi:hypothetical protein